MADVFISYKKGEQDLVKRIVDGLASYNISTWWDESLAGGQVYRGQIEDEISKAKAVIVIWTENSAKSDFVLDEADRAKSVGKLLPVRFSNAVKIPLGFGQLQTETLEGWSGAADDPIFKRVVDQVSRISQQRFSFIAQALGPNLRATAQNSTRAASAIWESLKQAEFLGLPLSRLFGRGIVASAFLAVALALFAHPDNTRLTLLTRLLDGAVLATPFFFVVRAVHQYVMFKKGASSRRVFDAPFRFWIWLSALIATMYATFTVDVADPMNIVRGLVVPFFAVLGGFMALRLVFTWLGGAPPVRETAPGPAG